MIAKIYEARACQKPYIMMFHRSSRLVFKEICKRNKEYTVIRSIQSKATFKHVAIIIIGHKMSQFRANMFTNKKGAGLKTERRIAVYSAFFSHDGVCP